MNKSNIIQKCFMTLIMAAGFVTISASSCFSAAGVLLMVKGDVTVVSKGSSVPAATGLKLVSGDVVTSQGGTATILLSNGLISAIEKDKSFSIPSQGEKGPEVKLASRILEAISETTEKGRGPTIKGMVRGEREITLLYPYNSFVIEKDLVFRWDEVEGVEDAELDIMIKAHSPRYKYSFPVGSSMNSVKPHDSDAQLTPGVRYYWKLTGKSVLDEEPFESKLCWFAVLAQDKAERLEEDMVLVDKVAGIGEGSRQLLKANLFISYELYHSAVAILEGELHKFPENKGLKDQLAGVFLKMKKYENAEKVME